MKSGSGTPGVQTDNPLYGMDLSESGFTVSAWIDANVEISGGSMEFRVRYRQFRRILRIIYQRIRLFNDNPGAELIRI